MFPRILMIKFSPNIKSLPKLDSIEESLCESVSHYYYMFIFSIASTRQDDLRRSNYVALSLRPKKLFRGYIARVVGFRQEFIRKIHISV